MLSSKEEEEEEVVKRASGTDQAERKILEAALLSAEGNLYSIRLEREVNQRALFFGRQPPQAPALSSTHVGNRLERGAVWPPALAPRERVVTENRGLNHNCDHTTRLCCLRRPHCRNRAAS